VADSSQREARPPPDCVGDDQTVRLWNLKTRELIVTLFNGSDGEWVMWTPQGYYTGSPGADKIIGWQINKGPDQLPDYVGADQLRQYLNRPNIVEKAIILASAETSSVPVSWLGAIAAVSQRDPSVPATQ
jgi:hypothetical protein